MNCVKHIMNAILLHDVVTVSFLVPYSLLCIAEVFYGYALYPLFLTHALIFHMLYDMLWLHVQPKIVPSMRELIMLHHAVAITLLMHPLTRPQDAGFTALSGLIEIDTSMLLLRRLTKHNNSLTNFFDFMYKLTNIILRVYFETFMLFIMSIYFKHDHILTRIHVIGGQVFITLFSYGICALTFSRKNPGLKN